MYSKFKTFLDDYASLDALEWQMIKLRLNLKYYTKGEIIHFAGDVCQELVFINRGLLRGYMIAESGKEYTWHIYYNDEHSKFSNYFATDYDSFINQKISNITIEVIEDCEVVTMSYTDIEQLFSISKKVEKLGRIIAQEAYSVIHEYMLSYLSDSAKTRFEKFVANHSDWFVRIPQHYIATHLGITPQSLCRLKFQMYTALPNVNDK